MPINLPLRLMLERREGISQLAIANVAVVVVTVSLLIWTIVTIRLDIESAQVAPNPYSGVEFSKRPAR